MPVAGVMALVLVGLQGAPTHASTPSGGQVVTYNGIQITVPSSWPVIELANDPRRCVRFDQHRLYLGRPATDQRCPARILGHTEAAIMEPLSASEVSQAMARLHQTTVDGQVVGMASRTAIQPNYTVVFPQAHLEVAISQGTDPAVAASIFSSLAVVPGSPPAPAPTGPPTNPSIGSVPGALSTASSPATSSPATSSPATTSPATTSPATSSPATTSPALDTSPPPLAATGPSAGSRSGARMTAAPAPKGSPPMGEAATLLSYSLPPPGVYTGEAFDTCSAPSTSVMSNWLASPYRGANIYIGGVNRGCAQPNLTSSWMAQVSGMGWSIIPTYVGLQAPCASSAYGSGIDPSQAASEGQQSADQAANEASALGMGAGSPIYDDMESYDYSNTSCNQAVMSFLDSWTAELHALGYHSGVYSSLYGGIAALVSQVGVAGYHLPDEIWFAAWPGNGATTTDPSIPAGDWSDHQRIHQYSGDVSQSWGGSSLDIDQDYSDALLAADGPGAPPSLQLNPGQSVVSPNGQYILVMQNDGNLVLYVMGGRYLWDTATGSYPGAYAVMQGDGNLVVYQSGRALWDSVTGGNPGAHLALQDDANLVVYAASGGPLWASGSVNPELTPNGALQVGWLLYSPNRQYELVMQGDGNLVVYVVGGRYLWDSVTGGYPGAYAVMQGDGNLVVYQSGRALWDSLTGGYPGAYLVMQSDGNLVVYQGGRALWDSGT